ncbi:acireductone synthase [Citrobacter sp. JGM124]|uniref:acireductone synthase n=1 Tax=Citrobacter sp. JGM124 TaxID=2799789 RepID=UPI001BA762BE|nr:acireductone synthase [Citrobacter sp. JGM124]MBS0848997.1 acireductone synthase [Citrobacter sp. JGM124]
MIRAIVTDIEGTITDIRFVHHVLFPYARQRMASFVRDNQQDIQDILNQLRAEIDEPQADAERLIDVLFTFMDEDRKSTSLKALQGLIWRYGYEQGDFTGHLYADVLPVLQSWKQQGLDLYIYSSGSVAAQKLLVGYSDAGDITALFSGYFDTHVGAKREVRSYQRIAEQIGLPTDTLLFLSDIHQELDAAEAAGWHTLQLIRGEPDAVSHHPQVSRFDNINLESLSS